MTTQSSSIKVLAVVAAVLFASLGSSATSDQSDSGAVLLPAPEILPPVRRGAGALLGGVKLQAGHAVVTTGGGSAWLVGGTGNSRDSGLRHESIMLARTNPAGTGLEHFSSYGGSGLEHALAAAVDGNGRLWLCGQTSSSDFLKKVIGAWSPVYGGGRHSGFISRHNADGELEWSSYVGGSGRSRCSAIVVNADGSGYLAGETTAVTLPGSDSRRDSTAGVSAFIMAWSAAGDILWSSFIDGGSKDAAVSLVRVGSSLWLGGWTESADLPVSEDAWQSAHGGGRDGFIARLAEATGRLEYISYAGGSGREDGLLLAAAGDDLWFSGVSDSAGLFGGIKSDTDIYAGKWEGSEPLWSEVYGGSGKDRVFSMAVGGGGDLWLAGMSVSEDFAVSADASQPVRSARRDAVVLRLSAASGAVEYASYLGGNDSDESYAVAVAGDAVWVSGITFSTDFPGTGLRLPLGSGDAFVQRYDQSNRAPRITSTPTATATVGDDYSYIAAATDPDGDVIAWSLLTAPDGMLLSGSQLSWQGAVQGSHEVVLEARDSRGGSVLQTYQLRVMAGNTAPRITSTAPASATVDHLYTYQLQAVDDDGDSLGYSLESGPLGMLVESDRLEWTPAVAGSYQAKVIVADGRGGEDSQSFSIEVFYAAGSNPPTLADPGSHTVELGTSLRLQLDGTDIDGDSLSYAASPLPLPAGASLSAVSGEFVFEPETAGVYELSFTVTDGRFSASATGAFTVPEPGADAVSMFSGKVLDAEAMFAGEEIGLLGVRVSLHGTDYSASTDSAGRFTLSGYPGGDYVLSLDSAGASSSIAGAAYAGFREKITLRDKVHEREDRAFTLPRLAAEGEEGRVTVNQDGETVLKADSMGVEMRIPQGMARNEDGSAYTGDLFVSEVPRDMAPAALPDFMDPAMLITIQPVGVEFSEPVPITFPNVDDLPPGDTADLWSLDPVTGAFAIVGELTVTEDGERLVTTEGGIRRADWHAPTPGPPDPSDCDGDPECLCKKNPNSPECDSGGKPDGGGGKPDGGGGNPDGGGDPPERPVNPDGDSGKDTIPEFNDRNFNADNLPGKLKNVLPYILPPDTNPPENKKDRDSTSPIIVGQENVIPFASIADSDNCQCGGYCCRGRIVGSTVNLDSGTMNKRVSLPKYSSLNQFRGLGLVYRSGRANPGRVIESNARVRGRPVRVSYRINNVAGIAGLGQKEMYLQTSGFNAFRGQPSNDFRVALPFDASSMQTGVYKYEMRVTNHYRLRRSRLTGLGATFGRSGQRGSGGSSMPERSRDDGSRMSRISEGRIIIENGMQSPIGAGWELSGIYRVISDSQENVLVVSPDTGTGYYRKKQNGLFYSPASSFSVLGEERSGNSGVSGYMLWGKHGDIKHFNSSGLMDYTMDRNGNVTQYFYDTASDNTEPRLIKMVDPVGLETHLRYRSGYLHEIEDPAGRTSRFYHDAKGNLMQVVYPDGSRERYDYQDHRMVMHMDEEGNKTRYEYSSYGQLVEVKLPDEKTRDIRVRTMAGLMADNQGRRESPGIPVHLSKVKSFYKDSRGFSHSREIDPHSHPLSVVDSVGRETYFIRNRKGSALLSVRPNNSVKRFFYDSLGNAVMTKENFNGAVETSKYDKHSQWTEKVNPRGNTIARELDARGNPVKVVNALGHTTILKYNEQGLVTKTTSPNNLVTTYEYNNAGLLETVIQTPPPSSPGEVRVARHTYYSTGLVRTSLTPDGINTTYYYDMRGRVIRTVNNLGEEMRTVYDEHGNVTSTEVVSSNGSIANQRFSMYDSRNRNIATAMPHEGETMSVSRVLYDGESNIVAGIDSIGGVHVSEYDAINRRSSSTHRLKGKSFYEYDKLNRLVKVTSPTGIVSRYEYDALGRRVAEHSADRGTTRYKYDLADNMIERVTARGIREVYSYDELERLVSIKYPNTHSGKNENIIYTYDNCPFGVGRLCKKQDESGTTEYSYDAFGNVTRMKHTELGISYTTSYVWDKGDSLSQLTLPSGRRINYSRDGVRRVERITAMVNGRQIDIVTDVRYRGDNLMIGCIYGNGLRDTRRYDLQGRLRSQSLHGFRGQIYNRFYGYDASSNVTSVVIGGRIKRYRYDALHRLVEEEHQFSNRNISYGYDLGHNRQDKIEQIEQSGLKESYEYKPTSNRLRQIRSVGQLPDGQKLQVRYEYNNAGRLWRYYEDEVLVAEYIYNGLGQRTRKILYAADGTKAQTIIYHWSMGMLVEETTDTGELIRDYILGIDGYMPAAQIDSSGTQGQETVSYLYADHMQTPRLATSQTQSIEWIWDSDSDGFGAGIATTAGSRQINIRFPGQYYDHETGLHYNRHRYYNSSLGRYITSDPAGLRDGINTYNYVGQNAVKFIDPLGLKRINGNLVLNPKVQTALENITNELAEFQYKVTVSGGDRYIHNASKRAVSASNDTWSSNNIRSKHVFRNGAIAVDINLRNMAGDIIELSKLNKTPESEAGRQAVKREAMGHFAKVEFYSDSRNHAHLELANIEENKITQQEIIKSCMETPNAKFCVLDPEYCPN